LNSVSERKDIAGKIVGDFATNGMDAYTEIYRLYIDKK